MHETRIHFTSPGARLRVSMAIKERDIVGRRVTDPTNDRILTVLHEDGDAEVIRGLVLHEDPRATFD
jgi:hypothetical protein